jgi:hypothetical protein
VIDRSGIGPIVIEETWWASERNPSLAVIVTRPNMPSYVGAPEMIPSARSKRSPPLVRTSVGGGFSLAGT